MAASLSPSLTSVDIDAIALNYAKLIALDSPNEEEVEQLQQILELACRQLDLAEQIAQIDRAVYCYCPNGRTEETYYFFSQVDAFAQQLTLNFDRFADRENAVAKALKRTPSEGLLQSIGQRAKYVALVRQVTHSLAKTPPDSRISHRRGYINALWHPFRTTPRTVQKEKVSPSSSGDYVSNSTLFAASMAVAAPVVLCGITALGSRVVIWVLSSFIGLSSPLSVEEPPTSLVTGSALPTSVSVSSIQAKLLSLSENPFDPEIGQLTAHTAEATVPTDPTHKSISTTITVSSTTVPDTPLLNDVSTNLLGSSAQSYSSPLTHTTLNPDSRSAAEVTALSSKGILAESENLLHTQSVEPLLRADVSATNKSMKPDSPPLHAFLDAHTLDTGDGD